MRLVGANLQCQELANNLLINRFNIYFWQKPYRASKIYAYHCAVFKFYSSPLPVNAIDLIHLYLLLEMF